ncbi:hypothetical protein Tco_0558476, partial [Tanacetum coccineum]
VSSLYWRHDGSGLLVMLFDEFQREDIWSRIVID